MCLLETEKHEWYLASAMAAAVKHFGLALQILPKHADPLVGQLWRSADGTVAPMLAPPVLEVLLTRMNARDHRSGPISMHMYTDGVICKPAFSLHLSLHVEFVSRRLRSTKGLWLPRWRRHDDHGTGFEQLSS